MSKTIKDAKEKKLKRVKINRLAQECAKLEPAFEKALAEEVFTSSGILLESHYLNKQK